MQYTNRNGEETISAQDRPEEMKAGNVVSLLEERSWTKAPKCQVFGEQGLDTQRAEITAWEVG